MRHILVAFVVLVSVAGPGYASDPIPPATTLNPADNSEAKRGCDLARAREFSQAYAILHPLVDSTPTDVTARACYATVLSGLGLHEQARQQMSIVLSWKPSFVEGYVTRAVSAAEMGATRQAKHDLDIARQPGRGHEPAYDSPMGGKVRQHRLRVRGEAGSDRGYCWLSLRHCGRRL